jgi:xanthosine utilization system XapX-like protein
MVPKAAAVVLGLLGALFPRSVIGLAKKLLLTPSYRNVAQLEPRDWYVTAVRVQSLLVALVGLAGIAMEKEALPQFDEDGEEASV